MPAQPALLVGRFSARRPPYEVQQTRALEWLAEAHARAEGGRDAIAFKATMRRRLARFGCGPDKIHARGTVLADVGRTDWEAMTLYDLTRSPHGGGAAARSRLFAAAAEAFFDAEYEGETEPPSEIIHVTCTGYVAPSAAQRLVARRRWGAATRVTHAYHMGCYAALPALRIAAGVLAAPQSLRGEPGRVDIVHTELCTLHMDPADHSGEQLVVQSLFGDGLIRYEAASFQRTGEPAFEVLALDEVVLPDSDESMRWVVSDHGMEMTLARDVPERIAAGLTGFMTRLFGRAGITFDRALRDTIFAVHPGGPRILEGVGDALDLRERQLAASRAVLFDHGNMSSATLPHIWMRLLDDPAVAPGTLVASLAFGPGLTVSSALMRKLA